MIASLTLLLTIVVLGIPASIVLIPWTLISGNAKALYKVALGIIRMALRLARIRVRVTGLERVPRDRACIFMSNHVSNLDPPVLLPRVPGRTSAFIKRSLMKIPALGYGMKLANFVPVDRDGRAESAIEGVNAARRVLDKGIHITTFVEGTRSRDGRMLPFKKGPFYLAMECGVPVVPMTIVGTHYAMPKKRFAIKPGKVQIIFHPPIEPKDFGDRDELMEKVRATIESGLPPEFRQETADTSSADS